MTDYSIETTYGVATNVAPVNETVLTNTNFDTRTLIEAFVEETLDADTGDGFSLVGDISTYSYDDLVVRAKSVLNYAENNPEYLNKLGSSTKLTDIALKWSAKAANSPSGSGAIVSKFYADAAAADLQAARNIEQSAISASQAKQIAANAIRGAGQLLGAISIAVDAAQAGTTQGAIGSVFSGLIGVAAASLAATFLGVSALSGTALIAALIAIGASAYFASQAAKAIWDSTPLGAMVDQALVDSGFWDLYFGFGEGVSDLIYDQYSRARSWVQQALRDPLTLDLDGDGIETIGANGTVLFDHDGDGVKNGSGWIKSDDGLLVLDRNGNGTIDSGRELFGADTIKSNGQQASSGFDALKDLDSNNDNVFNASDAQFGNVRVWRDLNQDGISQSNELFTLASLNIKAINLVPTSTADVNLGNGNVIDNSGTYVRNDNSIGGTAEVLLARNFFYRDYTGSLTPVTVTAAAAALPHMKGSGAVRDLVEAASLDADIITMVNALSGMNRDQARLALDSLLTEWASTSDMVTSKDTVLSNGNTLFLVSGPIPASVSSQGAQAVMAYREAQSAQLLPLISLLERFNGSSVFSLEPDGSVVTAGVRYASQQITTSTGQVVTGISVNLSQTQIDFLNQSYAALKDSVYYGIVMQTRLESSLDLITLDFNADGSIAWNYAALNQSLLDKSSQGNGQEALKDLYDLQHAGGTLFDSWAWQESLIKIADAEGRSASFFSLASSLFGLPVVNGVVNTGGASANELIIGSSANNVFNGGGGVDQMYGGAGDDTLDGGYGSDVIDGGEGNDVIRGGGSWDNTEHDKLYGGAGNDSIISGSKADIYGGTGNDILTGSGYKENYFFNVGDGQDVITDSGSYSATVSTWQDSIVFGEGISASDITLSRVGSDLLLSHTNGTDKITIKEWFSTVNQWIETIQFSDGTIWTAYDLTFNLLQAPTELDQTLLGVNGVNVTLSGGGGNDIINGADGNDVLSGDEGNDTLSGLWGSDFLYGGAGNDILNGGYGSDTLQGGEGDDVLVGGDWWGYGEYDRLYGGNGNDTLYSIIYSDMVGGKGNDTLTGPTFAHKYYFEIGDGLDTITDDGTYGQYVDQIIFGAGVNPLDISLSRVGNDLLMANSNGTDTITVKNWFLNVQYWIEEVKFADGTIWSAFDITYNKVQAPSNADQTINIVTGSTAVINAGGGNDIINGADGNDVLNGDDGNDTIAGLWGNDTLNGGNGNDNLNGGYGSDTLQGGEGDDVLVGGDWWSHGEYDRLFGGNGNDTLYSIIYSDMVGGKGNDTLTGPTFAHKYFFEIGDGQDTISDDGTYGQYVDQIIFGAGVNPSDIALSRIGNDLLLVNSNGTDTITVKNWFLNVSYWIEEVKFADGTIWSAFDITYNKVQAPSNADQTINIVTGSTATINAGGGNDIINGADGNDLLNGEDGNDTIYGNSGNDTLNGGNGNDIIEGGYGSDLIDGGAGDDVIKGGRTWSGEYDRLYGGAGNDYVKAESNAELNGGSGTDTLVGSGFRETYLFNLGDESDAIYDNGGYSTANPDKILFGAGITALDITISRAGNHLVLTHSNGVDQLTIQNWFQHQDFWVEQVIFANGTTWLAADINASFITGTAAADTITVSSSIGSVVNAGLGNDIVTGNAGNDALNGEDGNDTLKGAAGNDVLNGGIGIDTMLGGLGNDIYVVDVAGDIVTENASEGTDTVQSMITYTLGNNLENLTLQGTNAINGTGNTLDNVLLGNSANNTLTGNAGNDTLIGGAGTDSMIGGAGNDIYGVDSTTDTVTEKANGGTDTVQSSISYTLASTLENLTLQGASAINGVGNSSANVLIGNSAVNTLTGNGGSDTYQGAGGNDTIISGAGADKFKYSIGDGLDTISDSGGSDAIEFGAGIAQTSTTYSRVGNALSVSFGAGDGFVINNWFVASANKVELFKFADGTTKTSAEIDALIQAMGSFASTESISGGGAFGTNDSAYISLIGVSA